MFGYSTFCSSWSCASFWVLCRELEIVRSSTEEPLILELTSTAAQLADARQQAEEAAAEANAATSEARLARLERQWAEDRLANIEG